MSVPITRDRIIQSLDETIDSDIDDAWRDEIARREAQLKSGEAGLLPSDDVFIRVRDRLG
jgi:hypothetical protein